METRGTSGVVSGLAGDLRSLEEVRVELLSLVRLGRTLKRFLLVDTELVEAL